MLEDITAKVRSGDHDPPALESKANGAIKIHHDSVEITSPEQTASIHWGEIRAIFSYKADCWAYDLICIALGTATDGPVMETTEDMQGFVALKTKLEELYPGFDEAYSRWLISSPAFDTTPTQLWKKIL